MSREDWILVGVLIGLLVILVGNAWAQVPTPIQPQARETWGEPYGPPAPPRKPLEPRTAPLCWTVLQPEGALTRCQNGFWRFVRALDGVTVESVGPVVLP